MISETAAEIDLYQDVVMDHKRAPRHFGTLAAPTHQARGQNPQCGDDLRVALVVDDGRVSDIRFHGQGCAICMASASMMSEAVKGKDIAAAQTLQQHFRDFYRAGLLQNQMYFRKFFFKLADNRR